VPETAIDEHGEAGAREYDVGNAAGPGEQWHLQAVS